MNPFMAARTIVCGADDYCLDLSAWAEAHEYLNGCPILSEGPMRDDL